MREDIDAWMLKKGRKAGGGRMSALEPLKGDIDPLTKRIIFMGYVTGELEKEGLSPVAAGDYAVELYTSGGFKGNTVDVIAPRELIEGLLLLLDFKEEDGGWRNESVDILVRVLGEDLTEGQLQRVNQIDVNGLMVYLIGLEDLITDKLKDFVAKGDPAAIVWVQELIEIHVSEIDWDYLKERAAGEGVTGALQELIDELGIEKEEGEKFI